MKLRHIVMLAIFFCLAAVYSASAYEAEIKKMSATMAEKIAVTKKAKIAVVDFTDLQGDVTELGRFIAEEFSVALVNNSTGKGFKVVDRTHLKSIIKENKLSEKGLIDTARKLSKFAGVDALITGTLTSVGDRVRIIVKILDISTAETVDAISGYIASTDTVKNLLATNIIFRQGILIEPKEGNTGQSPRQSVQTVKAGGFLFQPVEGKFSDGNLILSFLTISPEKDKKIRIWINKKSRIIDYEGNEYGAIKGKIGSTEHISVENTVYYKEKNSVEKIIVAGVPLKSSIIFENIPPEIAGIALFEIHCDDFTVQLRDFPLSK
ncbi:MAG: hypothetical protein D3911_01010 [Candidatus Electrothrix sp. AW3_4]|nr:hypothetical protein [Candidatus Electrothrix gigas]